MRLGDYGGSGRGPGGRIREEGGRRKEEGGEGWGVGV